MFWQRVKFLPILDCITSCLLINRLSMQIIYRPTNKSNGKGYPITRHKDIQEDKGMVVPFFNLGAREKWMECHVPDALS
jgi:hypothetical protein